MISLKNPVQNLYNEFLDEKSYQNYRLEPFPKSTIVHQEIKGNLRGAQGVSQAVYFVTRDMKFKVYNITNYLDTGVFNLIYEI